MKNTFTLLFCWGVFSLAAQQAPIGGDHIYEFLNVSPSARVTGLGGSLITVKDDDVALGMINPAVLNPLMHQQISFNHNFHLAGINNGYASYGHHIKSLDATVHGGIQYISYGDFLQTDEFGQIQGNFSVSEYALTLGASHQLYDRLSVGANLKMITSQFEQYNSFGIVADFGALYQDTSGLLSIGLVMKNVGAQITTYADEREAVPFDMQLSISRRLRYLPFRLTILYHNLHRWNILYDDPNSEEETLFLGDTPTEDSDFKILTDNFFRHLIFSGEFLLGRKENLRIRLGYNHFQRKELQVSGFRSLAGFAFGLGIKVKQFRIEYGRGFYHLAGGLNHFSISTNLREFRR